MFFTGQVVGLTKHTISRLLRHAGTGHQSYSMPGTARRMYNQMVLKVKGNSDTFRSYTGLYQGETTSPIFFSFFVNDLESHNFNKDGGIPIFNIFIQLLMFADDMVIFDESIDGLQKSLDKLHNYCKK